MVGSQRSDISNLPHGRDGPNNSGGRRLNGNYFADFLVVWTEAAIIQDFRQ
jgi:hypothetical protein